MLFPKDSRTDADSDAYPDPLKNLSPNTFFPPKRFLSQRQSKAGVVNLRPLRQAKPNKTASVSSGPSSTTRSSGSIDTSSAHITNRNPPESKRRRIIPPVPTTRVTRASTCKIDSSKSREDEPMLVKDDEEEGFNI